MTLRTEVFAGQPEEWDEFVRSSAGWTHFHLWGWKGVMEEVFGHQCMYLAARDSTGLAAVLPLVRVKSFVFGDYLISMPFLNYGGPLGMEDAIRALVARAVELAREQNVELLELRCREPMALDLPVSHRKITVLLDLPPGGPDAVWHTLTSNVRRKVRRAEKEGMSVRFGPDQVGAFYEVFSHHMRDLGTPTLPRRLFELLAHRFGADVWFGCVYYDGRPVACACGFHWAREFEMTWVSALQAYHNLYANMFLYWAFIERAAQQGLTLFNFGRCTPDSGTHRFKQQWGSRDAPLWWYQHAAGRRAATPSPDDRAFSWGPRVWRRLPLPIANALGPRVVRLIP
jgi:FemAB-related protein (PEP-CTERM system-associated)